MYFMILDTETTNDIDCPLVYDFGFSIIDENGKAYASYSYVNADIFCDADLMSTAFFADKIPQYWNDIQNGTRILKSFRNIERIFRKVCAEWKVNTFVAHNIRFDYTALNNTKRYITTSRYRFFFPYGAKFVDTLKLSRILFSKNDEYKSFCVDNNYLTKNNCNRYTAEILYRFIINDNNFEEKHTGLEDCMIEKEIFRHCLETLSFEDGYLW